MGAAARLRLEIYEKHHFRLAMRHWWFDNIGLKFWLSGVLEER
jgi:hypothetical protein